MKNRTKSNIAKLTDEAMNQMDVEALCQFAVEHLTDYYSKLSREEFNVEWNLVLGED